MTLLTRRIRPLLAGSTAHPASATAKPVWDDADCRLDAQATSLFRARVSASGLRKAEVILARLGKKPGDAINMLLAQIELREGLPFEVTTRPPVVLNSEQQATEWQQAFGAWALPVSIIAS